MKRIHMTWLKALTLAVVWSCLQAFAQPMVLQTLHQEWEPSYLWDRGARPECKSGLPLAYYGSYSRFEPMGIGLAIIEQDLLISRLAAAVEISVVDREEIVGDPLSPYQLHTLLKVEEGYVLLLSVFDPAGFSLNHCVFYGSL